MVLFGRYRYILNQFVITFLHGFRYFIGRIVFRHKAVQIVEHLTVCLIARRNVHVDVAYLVLRYTGCTLGNFHQMVTVLRLNQDRLIQRSRKGFPPEFGTDIALSNGSLGKPSQICSRFGRTERRIFLGQFVHVSSAFEERHQAVGQMCQFVRYNAL